MSHDQKTIRGILLDIEGTTTPISFVHDVLFPFARTRVAAFLAEQANSDEVIADLDLLRAQHRQDVEQGKAPPPLTNSSRDEQTASLTQYIHWLIDQDRKTTGLKSIQGKIWKRGYQDRDLQAPLFADVLPALERWQRDGLKVAIFSSGSVLAQKLLFAHTEAGDVTGLIDAYFDTNTGSKTASSSYQKIAEHLGLSAPEIVFVSDVVAELDAAAAAGMQTRLCIRPGNSPQPWSERHQTNASFEGLMLRPGLIM